MNTWTQISVKVISMIKNIEKNNNGVLYYNMNYHKLTCKIVITIMATYYSM